MSDKAEIDVSEEAVEQLAACAGDIELSHVERPFFLNVASTLRELRRQLSEKEAEVVSLAGQMRWNIERRDGGVLAVCEGHHHRSEQCDFEEYVPKDRVQRAVLAGVKAGAAEAFVVAGAHPGTMLDYVLIAAKVKL